MDLLFLSKRIFLGTENVFIHGGIIVSTEGTIRKVLRTAQEVNSYLYNMESEAVYDFGNMVLMPGLIDTNVHFNEPGRKEWEGFMSGTKAAAAGGFTTVIDRPITAIPVTTSVAALNKKITTARGKIFVDVGFWGGLVPENIAELKEMTSAGVIGLQASLCPIPEPVGNDFGALSEEQLNAAIDNVEEGALIALHAELPAQNHIQALNDTNPRIYESFLQTRPPQMEIDAVAMVCRLALANKNKRFHILNISAAAVMPLLVECKRKGANLTCETSPHYLALSAEPIGECQTEFKTCPPIRTKENQSDLWISLKSGAVDNIASNHSPATPGVKCLSYGKSRGDFLKAWPGISSLQLGLSIIWTSFLKYGLGLQHIYTLMCANPSTLCGLQNFKGKIEEGYDADFCVWDPDEEYTVTADMLYSANKVTPYLNQKLFGVVHATIVRGLHVFQRYEGFGQPLGKIILHKTSKKVVKFVRI